MYNSIILGDDCGHQINISNIHVGIDISGVASLKFNRLTFHVFTIFVKENYYESFFHKAG